MVENLRSDYHQLIMQRDQGSILQIITKQKLLLRIRNDRTEGRAPGAAVGRKADMIR
jgi:hypothetical protein